MHAYDLPMGEDGEDVRVVNVEKLDAPPREPDADKSWWSVVVASKEGQHTLHVWVTGTAEIRLPEDPDERNAWVRGEMEKQAALYDEIDVLYALHPFELRVPLS